ncbi:MAG: hypothetical protein R3C99_18340 [Pirellulaceae bacterium]|nr:hypothetical protein [Planctomycetales bacterium]MCA9202579.1 hypothetical protein [Planctomycetales bacterium]MCA9210243.1 hypothetical protein [Planctomycetales bacterium]MCA9223810.1 hypothetical protein [Planctomycetales bacterium]MCA9225185.1 hypothetical protein [Planctomycetales bacterium]
MEPRLRDFFKQLLHHAMHSAIRSIFWKMPLGWALLVLAALVGVAIYFKLY